MYTNRDGKNRSYLKDLNGKMVKRTPLTHPYNYDEFVVWESGTKRGCSADYSDRLLQWDRKKFEECCLKVFGNKGQRFDNRTPDAIEKFLCLYYKEPIYLTTIVQGCNASSGYPYWVFFYNRAEKSSLGKRVDNGEWVEGELSVQCGTYHIISEEVPYEIEMPFNYTGLKDKKGAKIWQSSMVKWNDEYYIVNPTFEHQYSLTGMDGSNHTLTEAMCSSIEVVETVSSNANMNNVLKEKEECIAFILAHYAKGSMTPTREIEVIISKSALQEYLGEGESVEEYLANCTTDENNELYGYALIHDKILSEDVVYCDNFEDEYQSYKERRLQVPKANRGSILSKESYYWSCYI